MSLETKKCAPCEGGMPPLAAGEIERIKTELAGPWEVVNNKKLKREFIFDDFKQSMAFINRVADLAEEEQHHPDICVFYSRVVIELWTHAIGGLSENDFILARKIELL